MIMLAIFQFSSHYAIKDGNFGPFGIFLMFCIIQALAAVFAYFNLKEAKGLTGEEMKNLYKSKERVNELKKIVDEALKVDIKITSVPGTLLRDRRSFAQGSLLRGNSVNSIHELNTMEDFKG